VIIISTIYRVVYTTCHKCSLNLSTHKTIQILTFPAMPHGVLCLAVQSVASEVRCSALL